MKIVHICLSGLYMDGWGYQDNLLAKYHVLDGHDVTVIANEYMYDHEGNYVKIDGDKYCQPDIDCNGVKVVRLTAVGDKPVTGPAQRVHYIGLYDALKKIAPDIIFLHNPQILDVEDICKYMESSDASTRLDKMTDELRSVRLYVDSHSDYSNSARNFLSKHILHGILWRSKVQKLVPYTTKFYGVLPARVDFLLERYHTPKDKTELLVMGMDDEFADKAKEASAIEDIKNKLGIEEGDFVIISGGKIDHAKRQTLLLMDAVKSIDNPRLKLILFGSVVDDMREEFLSKCDKVLDAKSISDKLLSEDESDLTKLQIIYIGWLGADDTYPYFAASDLAVFPGRHSVMWEQVAGQGIPMVVKYWDGTTHVDVGGNVKFLYEDSVAEIQRTIESLMDRGSDYKNMKSIAINKASKEFSYRSIARKAIENAK